jgi:DegV family protein with EDD domain
MLRIITDSGADFEPYEMEQMGILCVPLTVTFGKDTYRENENLSKKEFFHLLNKNSTPPSTSQPTPYSFEKVFSSIDKEDEIVGIFLSSSLSGTFYGAKFAMRMYHPNNCYLVDSLNATGGIRLLVEYAVKLRDNGKTAKEIYNELEKLKGRIKLFACLDTMKYLSTGGRLAGKLLQSSAMSHVKPVIHINKDGKPALLGKAIGIKRGIMQTVKNLESHKPDKHYPIYLMYSHNSENAMILKDMLKEKGYKIQDKHIVNIGAAIGTHIGTNACGVVYVEKKILQA